MRTATQRAMAWMTAALALTTLGCSKEESKTDMTTAKSAEAARSVARPSVPSAAPPTATASAKLRDDCPEGSSGEGTFKNPCEGSGTSRMMEVTWTGKMDDKGPSFRVINKAPKVILFGKIAVYFYDKAGKQLEVKDTSGSSPGTRRYHTCSGSMFAGIMKPEEKAVITFSCVKKEHVPEGTGAIEAEMQMVGFTGESDNKVEYYWRNKDLTPDERPKTAGKKQK
jgi:hypothetical protein